MEVSRFWPSHVKNGDVNGLYEHGTNKVSQGSRFGVATEFKTSVIR